MNGVGSVLDIPTTFIKVKPNKLRYMYIVQVNRGLDNIINSNQWEVTLPEIPMCLCCQGLEMFPPSKVK